nr:immunoglobulin light chain junction region [Macaca mulatta]
CMQVLEFPWAF